MANNNALCHSCIEADDLAKSQMQLTCQRCFMPTVGTEARKYCDLCRSQVLSEASRISVSNQKRRSKNEIRFANLCMQNFSNVGTNEACFISKYGNWDADVILHDQKIAVLWNGIWHYRQIGVKHSLAQVQARDKIKLNVIVDNNYTPYIIVDMGGENGEFVDKQFSIFMDFINKTITL